MNGLVDLGEFRPEMTAAEAAQCVAEELGCKLWGRTELLAAHPTNAKPPNTYAGNYGLGQLPFHTDLAHWHVPPRYLMLRCAIGDPVVVTQIVHHHEVLLELSGTVVDRALFRPRRRLGGRLFLMRLRHSGIFRWDQLFLTPDNDEARQVREVLVNQPMPRNAIAITLDKPGRTILIDNWTTLHGRSTVDSSSNRRIERAYFLGEEYGQQDAARVVG
jgi:L-asparagine oxygenase